MPRPNCLWLLYSYPWSRSSSYQTDITSNHRHDPKALWKQAAYSRSPVSLQNPTRLTSILLDSFWPAVSFFCRQCMSSEQSLKIRGKKKKNSLSHYLSFDGQLTSGTGVFREGGRERGCGARLCLPVRAPGPPVLFCCDACVLSLAWLESLHLMVYSYSVVQDAVPWGSSHTQYVCKKVTAKNSESHFCCIGV